MRAAEVATLARCSTGSRAPRTRSCPSRRSPGGRACRSARRVGASRREGRRRTWPLAERVALAERLLEEGDLPIEARPDRWACVAEMLPPAPFMAAAVRSARRDFRRPRSPRRSSSPNRAGRDARRGRPSPARAWGETPVVTAGGPRPWRDPGAADDHLAAPAASAWRRHESTSARPRRRSRPRKDAEHGETSACPALASSVHRCRAARRSRPEHVASGRRRRRRRVPGAVAGVRKDRQVVALDEAVRLVGGTHHGAGGVELALEGRPHERHGEPGEGLAGRLSPRSPPWREATAGAASGRAVAVISVGEGRGRVSTPSTGASAATETRTARTEVRS